MRTSPGSRPTGTVCPRSDPVIRWPVARPPEGERERPEDVSGPLRSTRAGGRLRDERL